MLEYYHHISEFMSFHSHGYYDRFILSHSDYLIRLLDGLLASGTSVVLTILQIRALSFVVIVSFLSSVDIIRWQFLSSVDMINFSTCDPTTYWIKDKTSNVAFLSQATSVAISTFLLLTFKVI